MIYYTVKLGWILQSIYKETIYEIKLYDNGRRVYTNRFDCSTEGGGGESKEAAANAYN